MACLLVLIVTVTELPNLTMLIADVRKNLNIAILRVYTVEIAFCTCMVQEIRVFLPYSSMMSDGR